LRGSGVNLGMQRFDLNWMKNPFTCQVAKIWNSLEPDLRKENLCIFPYLAEKFSLECHFRNEEVDYLMRSKLHKGKFLTLELWRLFLLRLGFP